jgi:hypothetical protein
MNNSCHPRGETCTRGGAVTVKTVPFCKDSETVVRPASAHIAVSKLLDTATTSNLALTPLITIYEEDIKSPFRSAVSGILLRPAFIQVQKAKRRPFACVCHFCL